MMKTLELFHKIYMRSMNLEKQQINLMLIKQEELHLNQFFLNYQFRYHY